jgi:hypothetical protein
MIARMTRSATPPVTSFLLKDPIFSWEGGGVELSGGWATVNGGLVIIDTASFTGSPGALAPSLEAMVAVVPVSGIAWSGGTADSGVSGFVSRFVRSGSEGIPVG